MTTPRSVLATATLIAALAATGCKTQLPPPAVGADQHPLYPRVTAIDGLNSALAVRTEGVSVDRGDVLDVTVPVRNTSTATKWVQYRFFFFTDDGTLLDNNPSWRRARIAPGVQAVMRGTSVAPAADFQLEIRAQRG
jgi:uncharacterized protein YcfL